MNGRTFSRIICGKMGLLFLGKTTDTSRAALPSPVSPCTRWLSVGLPLIMR